jgi:phosphoribosylaminoimidazolecarboxamide formyltransferase/IMP cyclohydrolase
MELRYGENPQQTPAYWYKMETDDPLALHKFEFLAGNPSMINITDFDRALQTITHIAAGMKMNFNERPFISVGVKHGNPCGASMNYVTNKAIMGMLQGNPISIFGGSIMCNFEITTSEAELLVFMDNEKKKRRPFDIIVAPGVTEEALKILVRKDDKCLVAVNPALHSLTVESLDCARLFRYVRGGMLTQPNHTFIMPIKHEEMKWYGSLEDQLYYDKNMILAWAVCATSTSNTITLAQDNMIIANAVGQTDRVGAGELAGAIMEKIGHEKKNIVAVSDSFFPFPDGPQVLLKLGVKRILATSGSQKDNETIALFDGKKGIQLVHIPNALARMFYGH